MQSKIKSIYNFISVSVKKINEWLERHRIRIYAAQASFFIIISALPFLIIILSFLGSFLPLENGALEDSVVSRVPDDFKDVAVELIKEIKEKTSVRLMSLSAVALLWSSSRGIRGIGAGIRNVYGGTRGENPLYAALRTVIFTLIWALTVIMTLIILVFGDTITGRNGQVMFLFRLLNGGAFLVILTAVFSMTYCGFAGKKLDFFSQIYGAFFSAVGWLIYSRLFEYYVENYANYSYIYGSLTSIIVVMLWIYSCMKILFIGAAINVALINGNKNTITLTDKTSYKLLGRGK